MAETAMRNGTYDHKMETEGAMAFRHTILINGLVALVYWGVSHLNWLFFHQVGILPMPIWPSAAIALIAGLRWGWRIAPALAVGTILANHFSLGATWTYAGCVAVMNTAGPLVAASLVNMKSSATKVNMSVRLLWLLAAGLLLAPTLTASGGIGSQWLLGMVSWENVADKWFRWFLAHSLGALLFVPPMLVFLPSWWPQEPGNGGAEWLKHADKTALWITVSLVMLLWIGDTFLNAFWFSSGTVSFTESFLPIHSPQALASRVFMCVMVFFAGGAVSRMLKSLADSRRNLEQSIRSLKESEALQNTLLARLPNGVIIIDPVTRMIERVNEAAETMFGAHAEHIVGHRCHAFLCPANETACPVCDLGQDVDTDEREMICADGNKRPIIKSVIRLNIGGQEKLLECFVDITERKQAEEKRRELEDRLQRSEKMEALGQLAGGVAHDLNNILGVLSGYSELLLLETPEGQRSRGYAEKILQSTEKGAAIIQDLLTLARRGVKTSDVINLNSVVSGFFKTPVFEKMKDHHPGVSFRVECDKNLLNIKGSPIHLEKSLMNLVSNATESISGMGEVTIRTECRYLDKNMGGYDKVKEGDYAVLTVSDTGMGIPGENREKIFEPFYTKKTMGRSGTGLGLAIVWGTVKDHNGYIDLHTEVGRGTTFTLYFPVTREELIEPLKKPPIEQYRGKGESVLVVDDIAEQRDVAAGLLTQLGYEVHVISSGEEAVEYLKGNKADILVLDMIMAPGIDGLETYERVLEVNPKQKAILVSGFSETDRVSEAQRLGAGAYVKKPYVMEKIGTAIRDELNR